MSALRDFSIWVRVVGPAKAGASRPTAVVVNTKGADEAAYAERRVEAAEEEKERAEARAAALKKKAEEAAYKAKVMKRLEEVIGPYKKAMADQGPEAPLLQKLMAKIKVSLAKGHFAEAAKDLDVLKELLSKP
jgi:hypothetical protein